MNRAAVLRRGLYHLLGGLCIPVAALLLPREMVLPSLAVFTLIIISFELVRLKVPAANRWFFRIYRPVARRAESARLTGASYLLIGSLITLLIFPREIALLALFFLAAADAVAGVVGRLFGKTRVLSKTLEGDLACLVTCFITGIVCRWAGLNVAWPVMMGGAVGAAVAEAVSPLNDNLTMPVLAAAVMLAVQRLWGG